jgi:hypothetical protein
MADTHALAIGDGIKFEKTWTKDWWGPDPKLEIKFNAMIKALVIYRPMFQLYADAYAGLDLKACYGYCISVGADVQAKLATPNPNYLWAKATFHAFSKSFSFSGYIYGSGDLHEAETYTPKILDRIEPADTTIGIIPVFKVYTTFSKEQPVSITFSNVHLRKYTGTSYINVAFTTKDLEGDIIGKAIIPTGILAKNTNYAIVGTMTLSYTDPSSGKTETKSENFNKAFRTRNSNKIDFDTMVSYVKPANHQENVSEDTQVEIKYDKDIITRLGGFNNQYLDKYRVILFDSDDNLIPGHFTTPDQSTYKAVFVPSKELRVYRYCVNQAGEIRETFMIDNQFANPFNNYKIDNGVDNIPDNLQQNSAQAPSNASVGYAGVVPPINQNQQNSGSNSGSQGVAAIQAAASTPTMSTPSVQIPAYIRKGPITFKTPEALGDFVLVSYNDGKRYKYYRANQYKIVVRYYPGGNQHYQDVHTSTFKVRFNNAIKEAKRKMDKAKENLHPKLTTMLDVRRVGNPNPPPMVPPGCNLTYATQVVVRINDDLLSIGITTGIKTKVVTHWTYVDQLHHVQHMDKVVESWDRFAIPGKIINYSADITYYGEDNPNLSLYHTDMEIVSGDTFDSCQGTMSAHEAEINQNMAKSHMSPGGDMGPGGGFGPGGIPGGGVFDGNGVFNGGAMNFGAGI